VDVGYEAADDLEAVIAQAIGDLRALRDVRGARLRPVRLQALLRDVLEGDPALAGGGIPYPNPDLTRLTGGQGVREIATVAAVTGGAKSVFMGQAFRTAGGYGPVLLVSNEMATLTYAQRLMAAEAEVNMLRVRDPEQRTDDDTRAMGRAMATLSRAGDLFLLDGVFTVAQLRSTT
jgi:replicative DNA helicase